MSAFSDKNMAKMEKLAKNGGKLIKGVEFVDSGEYIEKAIAILETTGNLRLVGETGTGKTTLVYKLAELLGVPLFEDVLTQDTTRWDLLACDTLKDGETKARYGIVVLWLLNGGILYLDGFNYARPSILSLLESLADFRGTVWVPELGESFKRTEKHYLVISYNPAEKIGYSGTFQSNIATIRRFEGFNVDYLPAIQERNLVKACFEQNATDSNVKRQAYDFASKWVEIARKSRDLYKRGNLRAPLTTGNLKNYAIFYAKKGLDEASIMEIASSLFPEDERGTFQRLFEDSGEIDVDTLKSDSE